MRADSSGIGADLAVRFQRELATRGYVADAAQQAALARLEVLRSRVLAENPSSLWGRLRERLARQNHGGADPRGLYLWGGVGRGKTWLMDLFYSSLPTGKRRQHFHHFMREVHEQLRTLDGERDPLELLARRIAGQLRVLCLDELFVSDIADAMLLGGLFEALLRHSVMLVITSNAPPAYLYKDGLQRSRFLPAIELLQRRLEVLAVDGGVDYRLRQLQRQPIYLDSTAADTRAQLQRLFGELAPEDGENDPQLTVCGRSMRALHRRGDTVWFDFNALCEGPRSQNDYVELAREFHTVLLSDVPQFIDPSQDNAARRFVALVDEFYDQGVKLVLSAAASPQALYQGDRLQFEFQRTASRLIEMQAETYLARPHCT